MKRVQPAERRTAVAEQNSVTSLHVPHIFCVLMAAGIRWKIAALFEAAILQLQCSTAHQGKPPQHEKALRRAS